MDPENSNSPTEEAGTDYTWTARVEEPSSGRSVLHVTGTGTFPTPGYRVELYIHEPPGFNPSVLLLNKGVHAPTDAQPDVVTTIGTEPFQWPYNGWTQIAIFPEGTIVDVERAP